MDNQLTSNPLLANSGGYAPKMDKVLTDAVQNWWKNLTKEEILMYLAEQPDITADILRNMLANEQCTMLMGVAFSMATLDAVADFNKTK